MTIYFRGGEMDALIPSDGGVFETTQFGAFATPYARCAIKCGAGFGNTTSYAEIHHANVTTYWLRFDLFINQTPPLTTALISLYNSAGTEIFRFLAQNANIHTTTEVLLTAQSWDGSAFVTVGAPFSFDAAVVTTFNLNLVAATGAYQLYMAGSLRDSGTANTFTNIAKARLRAIYTNPYWSQIIVSDESMIGNFLYRLPIDTAGANTDWTGAPSDVNEITYSDATFNSSATNGDLETDTCSTLDLSAYTIQDVGLSVRANCGAGGPQNLQLAVRTHSTDYTSSSKAQAAGYAVSQNGWATNPNTSAAWTPTEVEDGEYGYKAIT